MQRKYEFTGETKQWFGITLRQIRAAVTIAGVVSSGDVGGWIEGENNFSPDAQVSGNAWVYGDAQVSGNAWVYGDAQVYGNAWVYGDAQVYGNARVYGDAALCFFGGFGSANRQTTAYLDSKIGVRIVCGCFTGTLEEFRASVMSTHGETSRHGKLYLGMANMIEARFDGMEVPQQEAALA